MTQFSDWVDRLSRERGYESDLAAAQAIGVSHAVLARWRTAKEPPSGGSVRKVASAFKVPMQEALVKAGYMKPEEAGVVTGTPRVESLSSRELLAELARRLGEGEDGDVVVAMRSSRSADPDLPTWMPPEQ